MIEDNNQTKSITKQDFFYLFIGTLKILKINSFTDEELRNFIDFCKEKNEYSRLLNNILPDNKYISESLNSLKKLGIIYNRNNNHKYYLYEKISTKFLINHRRKYLDEMVCFTIDFKEYTKKNTQQTIKTKIKKLIYPQNRE